MADEHDLTIESKLREAWRQERRYYNVRGASRFVIWFIALLALDFLIDWGLFAKTGLTGNIGIVLLLINVGILGWVLWFEWLRYLKPYDPVVTSLEVEKQHPGLTSLLVSYTQLKGPAEDQPNVSTELIHAMREQAVERSRRLDFREIVDFAQLKKLFAMAAGVLLLFGILSIRWSDHVGILFKRLAGSSERYPTKTQVMSVTGALTVRVGDPATITATAGGVLPEAGRIFTKPAEGEGKWKELPMKVGLEDDSFARELKGLSKDLIYYVRLGDDRSKEHRIRVIDSPRVVDANLVLEFPAYMNLEPEKRVLLPTVEVPAGTTVKWSLKCDPPVERCEVKTGDKSFDAQLADNGTTVKFELTAEEALKYTFRWTEKEKKFQYDDVQYAVKVLADGLPDVDLLQPTSNGLATVNKTLNLEAKATDDYGLSKAWLVYSLDGSEEKRIEIHDFAGSTDMTVSHGWKLSENIKELKTGSQITFAVEVADHHPDRETHLRRSATRQLTIVEPERYLEWFRAELAAQTEELKRSRDSEVVSSTVVKQIKIEEGTPE